MEPVLEMIDRVGDAYGLPDEVLTNLRIALDEVVTNIVKYAYVDSKRHEFTIRCEVRAGALETVAPLLGVSGDTNDLLSGISSTQASTDAAVALLQQTAATDIHDQATAVAAVKKLLGINAR